MSSKMFAGLVAGGFGIALYVTSLFVALFSPLLGILLALALPPVLGVMAGVLTARWLDLEDYGHQSSAGALAGFIAAVATAVWDVVMRVVMALIDKATPSDALIRLVLSRLPASRAMLLILVLIIISLLLYLTYIMLIVGISALTASLAGYGKDVETLHAILAAQERQAAPPEPAEEAMDPSLAPFMRPEYSPFVSEPPVLSSWQRRRLERERKLRDADVTSGGAGVPGARRQGLASRSTPPSRRQGPRPPRGGPRYG